MPQAGMQRTHLQPVLSKRQVYEQNSPVDATCDVTNSISETATESMQGATGHLLSADRRRPTRSPSPHVLGWGTGIQSRDLPASSLQWLPPARPRPPAPGRRPAKPTGHGAAHAPCRVAFRRQLRSPCRPPTGT